MTKRFGGKEFGFIIDYTSAAEKILDKHDKGGVLDELGDFMEIIGVDYAYVGKTGDSLRVHLTWPPESRTERKGTS